MVVAIQSFACDTLGSAIGRRRQRRRRCSVQCFKKMQAGLVWWQTLGSRAKLCAHEFTLNERVPFLGLAAEWNEQPFSYAAIIFEVSGTFRGIFSPTDLLLGTLAHPRTHTGYLLAHKLCPKSCSTERPREHDNFEFEIARVYSIPMAWSRGSARAIEGNDECRD